MECLSLVPSNSAKRKPTLIKEAFPCVQGLVHPQSESTALCCHCCPNAPISWSSALHTGLRMDRGTPSSHCSGSPGFGLEMTSVGSTKQLPRLPRLGIHSSRRSLQLPRAGAAAWSGFRDKIQLGEVMERVGLSSEQPQISPVLA